MTMKTLTMVLGCTFLLAACGDSGSDEGADGPGGYGSAPPPGSPEEMGMREPGLPVPPGPLPEGATKEQYTALQCIFAAERTIARMEGKSDPGSESYRQGSQWVKDQYTAKLAELPALDASARQAMQKMIEDDFKSLIDTVPEADRMYVSIDLVDRCGMARSMEMGPETPPQPTPAASE